MDFLLWLFKLGIPYYRQSIITNISTQLQAEIPLPKQMPTDVGRIFGLSVYTDTFDPFNNPLISSTQAQNLYLKLKDGSTDFLTPVRLDDLVFNFGGRPEPSGMKYLPVNEPGQFDLSTSSYINPTGIVSAGLKPSSICLNLWYINKQSYYRLIEKGIVLQNGIAQNEIKK
jgi:hypothetical protein